MATSSPTIAMFNSIINSQKNINQRKKTTSQKKNRNNGTPNQYSKFRNSFLSMYDMNSPTSASGSSKPRVQTTSATLKKMLMSSTNNSQIQDVNTVIINSWNDKPMTIRVNNDPKSPTIFENECNLIQYKRESKPLPPPFENDLNCLKQKFVKVLEGYRQRERILVGRCQYLETELKKSNQIKNIEH